MSLFQDPSDALAELRQDRLSGPLFAERTYSDAYLTRILAAAEGDAERALRVLFGAVEVLPSDATASERAELEIIGTRFVDDPGYDLDQKFFVGDRWGFIVLRHKPVSVIKSIRFVYPHPMNSIFTVPADWIQLDRKAGHINLVPGTQSFTAPLSAWVMQAMGGGRTIPRMIQIRYTAGIQNPESTYPELPDLVLQMAALRVLKGLFLPGSGSISADGMSQSVNVAIGDYQADIDDRLERLRQAIHGVRLMVV